MINLKGIFPPLPTSFDDNGDLALEKMQQNLVHLSKFELSGFLILGSNGETVMLSHEEKIEVFEATRKAIPATKLMLAGTGGQSTRETIELTRQAARIGADAAVVLNPFYYKGLMTSQALIKHYHSVGDQSDIPVIIYNMPANTGLDMSAETILAISQHPNIIGLKDSGGNLTKMGEIIGKAKPGFQVLAGSAGFLLPALCIGAVGGILASANIVPEKCIDIFKFYQNTNLDRARKLQLDIVGLNNLVTRDHGVPALKAAMELLGMYGGPCREPILPLTVEARERVVAMIVKREAKRREA
jgi:4-hydroxy-2-oxoglutarate aldolase